MATDAEADDDDDDDNDRSSNAVTLVSAAYVWGAPGPPPNVAPLPVVSCRSSG